MPATFVVDASVVVEFMAPGEHGVAADRFIGGLAWPEPIVLLAPDILLLEVANALRRLAGHEAISEEAADRSVARLPALAIATVPCSMLLPQAWRLRRRLTVYDATYAVLADALEIPLVTADRRLVRALRGTGITAWMVNDRRLRLLLDESERSSG